MNMKEIILKVLEELQDSQINIKSESAREYLANKIEVNLQTHVNMEEEKDGTQISYLFPIPESNESDDLKVELW